MFCSWSVPQLLTALSTTQRRIRHKRHCLWQGDMHQEARKLFNVILRELPQPLRRCSWCNAMCISRTNTVHLRQETTIPMDNANITEKLKGHEWAVYFIGTAFQFSKAGERLAPGMHNLYHTIKTDAALLVILVHQGAKKNQMAGVGRFLGGRSG